MQRQATITRSWCSVTHAKMYAYIGFVMCCLIGSAVGDYPQREAFNAAPNDQYAVFNPNQLQEPSQRLFWGGQGSNQVGGTGLWATLTNKFPFLDKMFGRMELSPQYGAPNQYDLSMQYGVPETFQPQYQNPQYYQNNQNYPNPLYYQNTQNYQTLQGYPNQYYQKDYQQGFNQQVPQNLGQRFVPFGRDVSVTDDAVIVTAPFVPPQQPSPVPVPVPGPVPVPTIPGSVPAVPGPASEPAGYRYDKPQYRLELPHK